MFRKKATDFLHWLKKDISLKKVVWIIVGAAIFSFGVHNIHQQTDITEGSLIGLMLLIDHWFGIPASVVTPVLDVICYALAIRYMGWRFIKISAISTLSVSLFYNFWELFPPMLPNLTPYPLLAAVLGGLFVGVGTGIILRQGGSSGGDDALALTISRVTHLSLSLSYLLADLVVLALSLTYISITRIVFSVLTVTISSFVIRRISGDSSTNKTAHSRRKSKRASGEAT